MNSALLSDPLDAPDVPADHTGRGQTELRYEDVAQDGRLRLEGIWSPMGPILWGRTKIAAPLGRMGVAGVRAVLAYVCMEGTSERISLSGQVDSEVRFQLGHTVDDHGAVNRIVFDTWLTSHAPRRARAPRALPEPGAPVLAARAFGRHVFTRPAAPAGQHRVLQLDDRELPPVPEPRITWSLPALDELPPGGDWLEGQASPDPAPIAFGLAHTDGNQHVNFLTYARLVEDLALRRFARLGLSTAVLGRRAEIVYRRPSFAGDLLVAELRAFRQGDSVGVTAALKPEGARAPSVLVRLISS